jgi:hypothetical protein
MERYLIVLKSYKRMPIELEQILRANIHPTTVRKHEMIQPVGTVSDHIYFIEKGLFRMFYPWDGKQNTFRFKKEDQFIISLKQRMPDVIGIEALEDSILWCFPGSLVHELRSKFHQFAFQYSVMLYKDRSYPEDAVTRPDRGALNYYTLCKLFPDLLSRVPIPYLASYTKIPESVFRHLHSRKIRLNFLTTRRYRRR